MTLNAKRPPSPLHFAVDSNPWNLWSTPVCNRGHGALNNSGPFFYLTGPDTLWDSNALPEVFPTAWTSGSVNLNFGQDEVLEFLPAFSVVGTVSSVTVGAIPEPSAFALVAGCLAAARAGLRRRRSGSGT